MNILFQKFMSTLFASALHNDIHMNVSFNSRMIWRWLLFSLKKKKSIVRIYEVPETVAAGQ